MESKSAFVDVESPELSELQFQDISQEHSENETHTFSEFPPSAADEDDESGDKQKLLEEDKSKSPSFWSFEYYQTFFDVETGQVLQRILGSMLPIPQRNFLEYRIRPNPDLYGPFWICATLVFTTAIAGNLANYFSTPPTDIYKWKYEFHKVSYAATAIYAYWWLVPTTVWLFLRWRGNLASYTYLETICVYGYSLAIYIPISILWVINISVLQWILVIIGTLMSGSVLVLTFWPAVKNDDKKIGVILLLVIVLLHGALATGFVLYFFHYTPTTTSTSKDITNSTVSHLTTHTTSRRS